MIKYANTQLTELVTPRQQPADNNRIGASGAAPCDVSDIKRNPNRSQRAIGGEAADPSARRRPRRGRPGPRRLDPGPDR